MDVIFGWPLSKWGERLVTKVVDIDVVMDKLDVELDVPLEASI